MPSLCRSYRPRNLLQSRIRGLRPPGSDLGLRCVPIRGAIKDARQVPAQVVDQPQTRQLLEQRLQVLRLRRGQILRATAELPHPRPELLALCLAQFLLVLASPFFLRSSATAPTFWATGKRSMID